MGVSGSTEPRKWRRRFVFMCMSTCAMFLLDVLIDASGGRAVTLDRWVAHSLPWAGLFFAALLLVVIERREEASLSSQLVHEAKEVSARGREALQRYELLAESTSDIALFASPDGRILECNRVAELAYGYRRDELLGMTIRDLAMPDALDLLDRHIEEADLQSVRFETLHRRKDGTPFEAESVLQGAVVGGKRVLVNTVRDISGRRAAERALRESERRYRGLVEMSPYGISVYQDGLLAFVNPAMLDLMRVTEPSRLVGERALDFVHPDNRAAVHERERAMMEDGEPVPHLEERLVRPDGSTFMADVSAVPVLFDGRPAIQVVIEDISERKALQEALRSSTRNAVAAVARVTEARDPYTFGHQERVAGIAGRIARELRLASDDVEAIEMAAALHDIGKIRVPLEILTKPGELSEAEMDLVREHPQHGAVVIEPIGFSNGVPEMVLQHHERMDGSGYPAGLTGDEILLGARVIAVADVLEAAASHRPYRPALGLDKALGILRQGRGRLFDARVVDACLRVMERRRSASAIEPGGVLERR